MESTVSILAINAAAAGADRLANLGYNATAIGFTEPERDAADEEGSLPIVMLFSGTHIYEGPLDDRTFTLHVTGSSNRRDGGVIASCELRRGSLTRKFKKHADDLVTALLFAIDAAL